MPKPLTRMPIRRLLIRSTNWIGDAVMTIPAVRAIRRNFPAAHITLLVKPWVAPVFEDAPWIDEICRYEDHERHGRLTGKWRLACELRARQFDAAILLQNAFEAALITRLAGIGVRVGFDSDGRRLLLTHPVQRTKAIRQLHQTRYYLQMLAGAGLNADWQPPEIHLSRAIRQQAETVLSKFGQRSRRPLIGINPSAAFGSAKQWHPHRFAQVADRICRKIGATAVIFGGPEDQALGRQIDAQMQAPAINLAGSTSLPQAMALVAACRLFITNDSGLMHVAYALKVPLVAIFGSTDMLATGPLGAESQVVHVPVDCSPCLKPVCPIDKRCMERITVEMVFAAAMQRLEKTAKGGRY